MSTLLKEILVFNLDIKLWSGRKRLTANDLQLHASSLPPKDLATLGSKRLCNPESLKELNRIEDAARSACSRLGVRFSLGYAVPKARSADLRMELDELRAQFLMAKRKFLDSYEAAVAEWIDQHPGWEHALRDLVPRSTVDAKMDFDYQEYTVAPPAALICEESTEAVSTMPAEPPTTGLERAVGRLHQLLYEEIGESMVFLWHDSLKGKESITRKALGPILRAIQKMKSLRILDASRIDPVVKRVEEQLSELSVASKGGISGRTLASVGGIVYFLSDPERIKTYAEHIMDGLPLDEAAVGAMQGVGTVTPPLKTAADPSETEATVEVSSEGEPETEIVPDKAYGEDIQPALIAVYF